MNTINAENGDGIEGQKPFVISGESDDLGERPEFNSRSIAGAVEKILKSDEIESDAVKWDGIKKISLEFENFAGYIDKFTSKKYPEIKSDIANYHHLSKARTRLKDMFWQLDNVLSNTLNDIDNLSEKVGSYVMAPIYFVIGEVEKRIERMHELFKKDKMSDEDIAEFIVIYDEYNKFSANYVAEFSLVLRLVCDPFNMADMKESFDEVVPKVLFDALKIPDAPKRVIDEYISHDISKKELKRLYDEAFQDELKKNEKTLQFKIEKEREILKEQLNAAKKDKRDAEYMKTLDEKIKYWEGTNVLEKELKKAFRWRNFELLAYSNYPVSLDLFYKIRRATELM
ncbi:hypothetical protein KKD70_05035 [Patescibacteria group bacterium]|nr:hypothetical protein [Patescibacteria group bacterium]